MCSFSLKDSRDRVCTGVTKVTKPEDNERVMAILLDEAAKRGLCGAEWRDSWWFADRDQMAKAYAVMLGAGPGALRVEIAGGGDAWIAPHVATGWLLVFAVSAAGEMGQSIEAPLSSINGAAKGAPDKWLSWWWAFKEDQRRHGKRKHEAPRVGMWVGGTSPAGAVLGQVFALDDDGRPSHIAMGEAIFPAAEGMKWFAWLGPSRVAAAKSLSAEGRNTFQNYMGMRASVVARARKLIRDGEVPNAEDDNKPVKMREKRGRAPRRRDEDE